MQENLDLLARLEPIVEEKVKAGDDLNELLRLKVELGKAGDTLSTLQQMRIVQSARLCELLAIDETVLLPWPEWEAPSSYEPDGPSLALALEENNPELAMFQRQIASAEARRELARLQSYPDITLGLNYVQLGSPVVNPGTPDAGQDPWGFTVAVNLPIWFEKYSAARAEALASMRASQNEYDSRRNMLKADLSASLSLLHDADRRLKLYGEDLLNLAEQAAQNTRTSYESGRADIPEVIDSERDLLELQTLYWRAAADAWQQVVTLQTLVNQPVLGTFQATTRR
jgi:outer membrane protein TolC